MPNLNLFISVLTAIAVILIVTHTFSRLITFIGQPKVVGEMIAGVLLGPTCFGYFFPGLSHIIFSHDLMPFLYVLGNLGLALYMFLVGCELDLKAFDKSLYKASSVVSTATIAVPLILGFCVSPGYYPRLGGEHVSVFSFSAFVSTALALTAFPVMARILHENNLLKTRLGAFIMLSASLQDAISWLLLAFVVSMAKNLSLNGGLKALAFGTAFLLVAIFIVKPVLKRLGEETERNKELSLNSFIIIIILLLISALVTDLIGLHLVFGSFILGLITPKMPTLQNAINSKLKHITLGLLLPLFFTYTGLNSNMLILGDITFFVPCLVLMVLAFASKYLAGLFSMKFCGFNWSESAATASLVNARGMMELVIVNIGLTYGIINQQLYSILILIAIVTTLSAMPLFNLATRRKPVSAQRQEEVAS